MKNKCLALLMILTPLISQSQELSYKTAKGVEISSVSYKGTKVNYPNHPPLFSFELDGTLYFSNNVKTTRINDTTVLHFSKDFEVLFTSGDLHAKLHFINSGKDTMILENVVPFGINEEHTYITSNGPWSLTRAKLFRPGYGPVNVILPDNTWELGYGSYALNDTLSICALARRHEAENAQKHRYKTYIYPGGSLIYQLNLAFYTGKWQYGLKKIFQEKYLYDLEEFDNSLFERTDLSWIRHTYVIGLNYAWDKDFFDGDESLYTLRNYLSEGKSLFGGYDVYALWPTWPRLGLDERNQFDLFRDLPGGLKAVSTLVKGLHNDNTRFFICFNPWDESTRNEDPYRGIARIIQATDADGVVLDCSGKSNERLQKIADSIKPGVIMYSEGMAVVKDMPGIVAGRVHNAIYYSPPLNLNKLIKPDFAIFRVLENRDKDLKREMAISFFNGYGVELNSMGPGRPAALRKDLLFLGRTSMILRQNSNAFISEDWTPLAQKIQATDSIWVNAWSYNGKTIYTILSLNHKGYEGTFGIVPENKRYIDLWNHEELKIIEQNGSRIIPLSIPPYSSSLNGTRQAGEVACIAAFPKLLSINDQHHQLMVSAPKGDKILVWRSDPSYQGENISYDLTREAILIDSRFIAGEEKICIQLFDDNELMDEIIYNPTTGKPWLISESVESLSGKTSRYLKIEGGEYSFLVEQNDHFIPYPGPFIAVDTMVTDFYIERNAVSNAQFKNFLEESSYQPRNRDNFLKHWKNGNYPDSIADSPVVYVDYDDVRAYAEWAGMRLPTELEWQYAMEKEELNYGQVWELTNDRYDNGSHTFIIIKGGSYYKPESSWWYIQGGKQAPQRQQMLLQVSPGFDRASTVGFRCVMD